VDGGADDADTLLLIGLLAEVIAPEPHERHLLAGASEGTVGHLPRRLPSPCGVANTHDTGSGDGRRHELSSCHGRICPVGSPCVRVTRGFIGCVPQLVIMSTHIPPLPGVTCVARKDRSNTPNCRRTYYGALARVASSQCAIYEPGDGTHEDQGDRDAQPTAIFRRCLLHSCQEYRDLAKMMSIVDHRLGGKKRR